MSELQVPLSEKERQYLLRVLDLALGETRAEVHHTRTPDFRDGLKDETRLIRGLLDKLRQPQGAESS